jgi:thiamine-phosphate pyrophosphorylase
MIKKQCRLKFSEGLYAVITEKFCRNGSSVETLKQVLAGGVKLVQLREKDYPKNRILSMAKKFRKLTKKAGALLIINDYLDIALTVKADGVHLGQEDLPCAEAKKIAPGLIVGMSTHNIQEALRAKADGADYINIGPVFSTKTKEIKYNSLGLQKIKQISRTVNMPFTVMGGIKECNVRKVIRWGAKTVAMITEITMNKNPSLKTAKLMTVIKTCLLKKGNYKYGRRAHHPKLRPPQYE